MRIYVCFVQDTQIILIISFLPPFPSLLSFLPPILSLPPLPFLLHLHHLQEFLKKEYSHENIYFWTACERYKRLTSPEEMRVTARQIFERHLYSGAPEPVNVDSQARQDAQDGLHVPNESLFAQVCVYVCVCVCVCVRYCLFILFFC